MSYYRLHGGGRLQPKRSTYSAQFKLQVLSHQERQQLSNRQVAAIYNIRNANQIAVWRHLTISIQADRCQRSSTCLASGERAAARAGSVPKKVTRLDPSQKVSSANKARIIIGLRRDHKLADLLQAAGLARSTFYYQCQAMQHGDKDSDMKARIQAIYSEHKRRYGYRRITAQLYNAWQSRSTTSACSA